MVRLADVIIYTTLVIILFYLSVPYKAGIRYRAGIRHAGEAARNNSGHTEDLEGTCSPYMRAKAAITSDVTRVYRFLVAL